MWKYWHVINVGIQNTLVYRANFFFRASFSLVPLLATILLWTTIFHSNEGGKVGSYSLSGMISYYLLVMIVDALTAVTDDDWQIASDIREGGINQFLLKPIDFLFYRFCLFGANRLIYVAVAAIPVGLFIFFWRDNFVLPANAAMFGWFLFSMVLTGVLQFLMSYTMALLAFWLLEVSTFIFIVFAFEYVAGGHLFPLNILPPTVATVLHYTPFPYLLFFPVSIYLGQLDQEAILRGIFIQGLWTLAFYGLARFTWSRGIKKYSAFGG
jgi:ABC-2 type transport system permease protein